MFQVSSQGLGKCDGINSGCCSHTDDVWHEVKIVIEIKESTKYGCQTRRVVGPRRETSDVGTERAVPTIDYTGLHLIKWNNTETIEIVGL